MSDANNEISKTVSIQSRTALGLTIGLACSIPLTAAPALAGGNGGSNHEPRVHAARQNMQLNALQQLRAERRAERRADRLDASLSIQNAVHSANFNLNSGRQAFSANNLGNFQQLTIDVGGTQRVVNLDSKLSAAELVAAQQVLNGGVQTIELRSNGAAAGGSLTLSNSTLSALDKSVGGAIGSLTVARGVQVIDNNSGMNLSGNLRNHGTISAASDSAGQTITISADTINNSRNASIGTYAGNDFFGADVTLNASTSITNNGSISSANTLTLNAPVISNINDGSVATLSAGQNVNLNTANLVNTGLINANAGNINVNSNTILNFAGAGGTLQANNGSINLTATNANLTVTGGDLLSQDVNLSAGKGNIEATFGQADGVVNAQGCVVHLYADSDLLNIGTVDATDDPIITNVNDIALNATLTAGAPLTVISGGNITASNVLNTSGAVDGGDLTLIAGAQFKMVGANVNVSKKSTTGGSILVAPGGITTSGGTGDAGDIIMVAYAGKTVGSGQISTNGASHHC